MKRIIATFQIENDESKCVIQFDSSTQKLKIDGESYPSVLRAILEFQKATKDCFQAIKTPPGLLNQAT